MCKITPRIVKSLALYHWWYELHANFRVEKMNIHDLVFASHAA